MHLSREIILDASFAILEQYGLADMTMRRLANQMGVAPGAMYWHFKNKQELIDATARVILTPILEEEYETLEDAATDLRERLLEFRDGAELVGASLIDEDLRGELLDTLTSTLDTPNAEVAAATMMHYVMGVTALEQHEAQVAKLTGATPPSGDADHNFAIGVGLIIKGIYA